MNKNSNPNPENLHCGFYFYFFFFKLKLRVFCFSPLCKHTWCFVLCRPLLRGIPPERHMTTNKLRLKLSRQPCRTRVWSRRFNCIVNCKESYTSGTLWNSQLCSLWADIRIFLRPKAVAFVSASWEHVLCDHKIMRSGSVRREHGFSHVSR